MKEPKLKRFPKKPSAKASLKVWENYEMRVDKIVKDFEDKKKDFGKYKATKEKVTKKIDSIKRKLN